MDEAERGLKLICGNEHEATFGLIFANLSLEFVISLVFQSCYFVVSNQKL